MPHIAVLLDRNPAGRVSKPTDCNISEIYSTISILMNILFVVTLFNARICIQILKSVLENLNSEHSIFFILAKLANKKGRIFCSNSFEWPKISKRHKPQTV